MRLVIVALLAWSTVSVGAVAAPRAPLSSAVASPVVLDVIRADSVRDLAALFPPAIVRLYLVSGADAFGAALAADLRRKGYALVEGIGDAGSAPGLPLSYSVDLAYAGLYRVTLRLGPHTMTRGYISDATGVAAAGSWSIDMTNASAELRERVELLAIEPYQSWPSDLLTAPPPPVASRTDAGSVAWAARLRAGPAQGLQTVPVRPEPALSAVAGAVLPPPLPPRLMEAAPVQTVPVARSAPPIATAKAAPGPWRVQLGTYNVPADAQVYARDLMRRHAPVLSTASPFFVRTGTKLPRTVLQVGPYATRADAVSVCLGLRASRADCIVVLGG